MLWPKVHVFGHIHAGRSVELVRWDELQKTYEEVCARRAGWSVLVSLVEWKMVAWFWGSRLDSATTLVSASSVGGLMDDQEAGSDRDRNMKFWRRFELPIASYEQH